MSFSVFLLYCLIHIHSICTYVCLSAGGLAHASSLCVEVCYSGLVCVLSEVDVLICTLQNCPCSSQVVRSHTIDHRQATLPSTHCSGRVCAETFCLHSVFSSGATLFITCMYIRVCTYMSIHQLYVGMCTRKTQPLSAGSTYV